jgi:hypothetical protein
MRRNNDIARLIALDPSETSSGFDAPRAPRPPTEPCFSSVWVEVNTAQIARERRRQVTRAVQVGVLILVALAAALGLAVVILHLVTGAAAAMADPIAGMPW